MQIGGSYENWERLVSNFDFFSEFNHYIAISICSNNAKDFHKW